LNAIASEDYKKLHYWPKCAKVLSEKLQRIETSLRAIDIVVELKARDRLGRRVIIRTAFDKKSV
jgi:hypothetical protein